MKEELGSLAHLQSLELKMRKLEAMLASIPTQLDALDVKRQRLKEALDAESETVENLQTKYRSMELDFKQFQNQLERSEIKLRAVKTNKEYQATLKEIEELKSRGSSMEDEMLQCLEDIDEMQGEIARKKKDFVQIAHQIDMQKKEIEEKSIETRKKHQELASRRDDVAGHIPKEMLEKYHYVKRQHSDQVAIAPVVNAVCAGCNMNIPPQMYIELQRQDQLMVCPQCQRLIYWHQQPEKESA